MTTAVLTSDRLTLDRPGDADIDDIVRYCQDPVFERYLTVPWPYTRADAEYFVQDFTPAGWADGSEHVWAIRPVPGGPLLGVISIRRPSSDVGFWLGAEHRGGGIMTEALRMVVDHWFETGNQVVRWECLAGNLASAGVARKVGFRYAGQRGSRHPDRAGGHPPSWHGELRAGDDREPKPGWPA